MSDTDAREPTQLATDEMPDGVEPPSDDELLAYLAECGFGEGDEVLFETTDG